MNSQPSPVSFGLAQFAPALEAMRKPVIVVLAVVTLQTALYFVSWDNFFSGDSLYYLSRQTHTWSEIKSNFLRQDDVSQYRPLTYPVFTFLLYPIGGLNPLPYHLTALAIHVLLSLAVFWFLSSLLQDYGAALAGYLFYSLHSVAYFISYGVEFLPDWLFAIFFISMVACFLQFLRTRRWSFYCATALLFLLALLSKETSVMTPFALFSLGMLEGARQKGQSGGAARESFARSFGETIVWVAPFAAVSVFYLFFLSIVKGRLYPESPTHPFHLTLQPEVLVKKVKYLFWVWNVDLRLPERWLDFLHLAISALALTLAGYLVVRLWKNREKRYWTAWLLLWAIAMLFPVLFLVEPPYPHHLYIPLVALSAAVGLFFLPTAGERPLPSWLPLVLLSVNLAASFLTVHRFNEKSWVAHGSRVARNFLISLKRHHPGLSPHSVVHLTKSKESNSIWYFDRHALLQLFYHDPTLSMRYEDVGEKLPPGSGPPIPNYFVYGLWEGNFDYLPDYWNRQSLELLDWVLQGQVTEDRSQYYPRFDQFMTPNGRRVFSHYLVRDGERRNNVVTLAGTRLRVPLPFVEPGSKLHVGLASVFDVGDGFRAALSIERDGKRSVLIDRYIHSAKIPEDRTWLDYHLDLDPFVGSNNFLILECDAGPSNNTQADWLAWSILKINKQVTS